VKKNWPCNIVCIPWSRSKPVGTERFEWFSGETDKQSDRPDSPRTSSDSTQFVRHHHSADNDFCHLDFVTQTMWNWIQGPSFISIFKVFSYFAAALNVLFSIRCHPAHVHLQFTAQQMNWQAGRWAGLPTAMQSYRTTTIDSLRTAEVEAHPQAQCRTIRVAYSLQLVRAKWLSVCTILQCWSAWVRSTSLYHSRLRSSTTSALVVPRTVRSTIGDRTFPATACCIGLEQSAGVGPVVSVVASFPQQTENRTFCPVSQLWLRTSHCTDY